MTNEETPAVYWPTPVARIAGLAGSDVNAEVRRLAYQGQESAVFFSLCILLMRGGRYAARPNIGPVMARLRAGATAAHAALAK